MSPYNDDMQPMEAFPEEEEGYHDDPVEEDDEIDESELGHHRINLDNIETDADRQKTIGLLRGLPCPMATKKKLL